MNLLKQAINWYKNISDKSRKFQGTFQTDFAFQGEPSQPTLLILPDELRATYYLSFHFVLQRLHHTEGIGFYTLSGRTLQQAITAYSYDFNNFATDLIEKLQPSIVIFSRYGLPYGEELLQLFQEYKIPTIYYIDDDLINLPKSSEVNIRKQHSNSQVIHTRTALLNGVDLIYTSTPYLQQRLANFFSKQNFYCSTYPPYLQHLIVETNWPAYQPFTIGYMASKSHKVDLEIILPDLIQILTDYPQVRFETFGTISLPNSLTDFSSRTTAHQVTGDYSQFLQKLHDLHWDIGLAPLQDTEFNRCKSPVKFIEYTSCGIPVIASDINVYNQFSDGFETIIASSDGWYTSIKNLIEDDSLRAKLVKSAQSRCSKDFALDIMAEQFYGLLTRLHR